MWHDMDVTANRVLDKIRQLMEGQRDILAYTDNSQEEVEKALKTPNFGTVKMNDANGIKTVSIGGLKDQTNWQYMEFILNEQTKQGANPDVLAGRGAQAPTLGQEQMVLNNATRIVNNMYTRFQDFMTSILKKLAWLYWTDPEIEIPVIKEIQGYGPLPAVFTEPDKVADFYDFAFEIIPYSTQRTSPELQYQKTMQFMTQWMLPTAQMAQAQGAQLDVPTATKRLGEYLGIKNLNEFFITAIPQPGDSVPYQMQPTTKRNEQRTRPGASGQSNDAFGTTLGNQMGNQQQQQERESNV
jgi:hypothetical protein